MLTAFDLLFICVALLTVAVGLLRLRSMLCLGKDEDRTGNWSRLIGYLISHEKIFEDRRAGTAHFILFFGFIVFLLVSFLGQFGFTLPFFAARCVSLITDLLGVAMLGGVLFFLVKRAKFKQETRMRTILPLIFLMIILLTGFLAEGSRLRILQVGFSWFSPVGWFFSLYLPSSPLFMLVCIRLHFFSVLFFVAALPYTSMRHLIAGAMNVYYWDRVSRKNFGNKPWDEWPLGARTVEDLSWKQLLDAQACVSCGRCEENCPSTISGEALSPRKVVRDIFGQMEELNRHGKMLTASSSPLLESRITGEELWSCTTCMACVECCPVFINHVDKVIEMRRNFVLQEGRFPRELYKLFQNLEIYGDTFGKGIASRKGLSSELGVKIADGTEDVDWLLWVGCQASFHNRAKDALSALVRVLKNFGIDPYILGADEVCCGNMARMAGNEYIFRELARKNISSLKKYKVRKIVTLCPHCFNTLKNDYSELGAYFDVRHYIHLLGTDMRFGQPKANLSRHVKVAFHDPCYLSRINSECEAARNILDAVPQIEIVEMERSRLKTFCCGAGGGRIWMPEHKNRRMNELRAEQALAVGADVLLTACPYCLVMLEDGVKSLEARNQLIVKDLNEILETDRILFT